MLAADPDLDLAVLKVAGVKALPQPVDLDDDPKLTETMPVYVFGFPFGEVLATGKGNPAITIGKGSVSSLRLDERGELARVQIDGALNPGNSGGPVVHAREVGGRCRGHDPGQHRHWAHHPFAALVSHAAGPRGEGPSARLPRRRRHSTIHVDVNLIDPLGKIKSVTLRYLPANKVPENIKPADLLSALPGCRELPLKIDGRLASAELSLKKGVNAVTMRYQVAAVGSLDQVSHTNNFIETICAPATPSLVIRGSLGNAVGEPSYSARAASQRYARGCLSPYRRWPRYAVSGRRPGRGNTDRLRSRPGQVWP